jgi:hypothetical protein
MRKLTRKFCTFEQQFIDVLISLNVNARVIITEKVVFISFEMEYIPAVFYGYTTKNYKRFIKFLYSSYLVVFYLVTSFVSIFLMNSKKISSLFRDGKDFIY